MRQLSISFGVMLAISTTSMPAQQIAPVGARSAHVTPVRAQDARVLRIVAPEPDRARSVLKGALWGTLVGTAIGGLAALYEGAQGTDYVTSTGDCGPKNRTGRDVGISAVAGAAVGVIVGFSSSSH